MTELKDNIDHMQSADVFSDEAWEAILPRRITNLLTEMDSFLKVGTHFHAWSDRPWAKLLYKIEMYHPYMTEKQKQLVDLMIKCYSEEMKWIPDDDTT